MLRRHIARWCGILAALSAFAAAGCAPVPRESNAQIIRYHQDGDPVITIDPKTGMRVRTTRWRYDDGYTTETVERIPIGGTSDFRRNPVEPAIRVTED
ncbi:MAG TPA: hypothetical protein VHA35_01855 [Dongiaceae bacterium]|jgi:hypothetical protein|nr:hypothetical protein [Dongiaceae bacterium]